MAGPPHGPYRGLTDEEKAQAPKFTKELGFRILSYLRPYKLKFFIVIVVVLLSAALGVVPSLLTGRMVDDGLIAGDFRMLVELIIAAFVVTVVSNALSLVETWLNTSIAQGIIYDLKTQMYAHFQRQPYQYFVESRQGEIVTRMTGDVNGVQSAVSTTMTNSIKNIGTIIVSIVALVHCNWILALTGLAIIPLYILPTRVTGKRRWLIARDSQEKYDEANTILGETLSESGILLVWLFGRQKKEYDRFKGVSSDLYRLNIREMLAGRSFFMFLNIFTNFGPLLLYLVGGILMLRMQGGPQVTIGEITAAISILGRIYRPVNELMNVSVDFTRSLALFERIFQTLDMVPNIVDKEDATAPENIRGEIDFDGVRFAYNAEQGPEILKGLSFHVEPGETYALVGSSGAGKSTMISLVPRLYDVLSGAIRIDGKDVRDWPLQELRKHIGFVTQDTFLFNDTIRANLLYAKDDASDEELMDACRRAGIADFIEELKDGLDTLVGNRGVRLSGGEKQRLSLARVILKDPEVILLDEATASLDSVSESHIQEALAPLLKEKTSLVVAHRLSTILDSDCILVLKDGHIVASGKHAELIESSEDYKTFYDTQFKAGDEAQSQRRRALREQRTEAEVSALAWRRSQGHWQELGDFESYY